jgi:hypothetical protein
MRTFILAVIAVIPSCAIGEARAADEPPAFDIARNCNSEATGSVPGAGVESCTRDETEAKNELAKRWSQFDASQKKVCISESSTGGDQSYVELLTCLEMPSGQFRERQKQ